MLLREINKLFNVNMFRTISSDLERDPNYKNNPTLFTFHRIRLHPRDEYERFIYGDHTSLPLKEQIKAVCYASGLSGHCWNSGPVNETLDRLLNLNISRNIIEKIYNSIPQNTLNLLHRTILDYYILVGPDNNVLTNIAEYPMEYVTMAYLNEFSLIFLEEDLTREERGELLELMQTTMVMFVKCELYKDSKTFLLYRLNYATNNIEIIQTDFSHKGLIDLIIYTSFLMNSGEACEGYIKSIKQADYDRLIKMLLN